MKVGKKLEAVEADFLKLTFHTPREAEAMFKALAHARGVSEATYSKRWGLVWHLVRQLAGTIRPEVAS